MELVQLQPTYFFRCASRSSIVVSHQYMMFLHVIVHACRGLHQCVHSCVSEREWHVLCVQPSTVWLGARSCLYWFNISMCVSVQECVYNSNYSSVYVCTHVILQSCMTVCATASTRVQTGVQVLLLLLTLQFPCVHSSDECSEVRRQMVNSSVHVLRHMVSLLWSICFSDLRPSVCTE